MTGVKKKSNLNRTIPPGFFNLNINYLSDLDTHLLVSAAVCLLLLDTSLTSMMSRDLCITILWFLFRNWSLLCLLYRAVLYFLDSAAPYVNAGAATAITRLTTSDSNSSPFLHSLYTADVKPFMPSAVAQPTYRLKLVNRPQSPYIEVELQVIDASHLKLEGPDEHDREFMKAGLRAHPGLCTDLANELAQQERQLQDRLAARLAQRRILLDERWRALVSMTLGVIRDYDEQIHCCLRQEHAAWYSCQVRTPPPHSCWMCLSDISTDNVRMHCIHRP